MSPDSEHPAKLQVSQDADGISADDTGVIENLLKFGCRLGIPPGSDQGLAAYVGRVQTAKIIATEVEAVRRQRFRVVG